MILGWKGAVGGVRGVNIEGVVFGRSYHGDILMSCLRDELVSFVVVVVRSKIGREGKVYLSFAVERERAKWFSYTRGGAFFPSFLFGEECCFVEGFLGGCFCFDRFAGLASSTFSLGRLWG